MIRPHHHIRRWADRGLLTSDSKEAADITGEARILMHSRPSFSHNTWRRSGTERSRAAPKDMTVGATQKGAGGVTWQNNKQHQTTSSAGEDDHWPAIQGTRTVTSPPSRYLANLPYYTHRRQHDKSEVLVVSFGFFYHNNIPNTIKMSNSLK